MAKRFTDTNIWDEDWFLDLDTEEKLFWFYLKDACDHAGIWRVNRKKFEYILGKKWKPETYLQNINSDKKRILEIGDRWWIMGFVNFQYGEVLNLNNRMHQSVFSLLKLYKVDTYLLEVKERSIRPLVEGNIAPKDKDKYKDKEGKEGVGEKPKIDIHPFQAWIAENCPRVTKAISKQLTFLEAEKLVAEFDKEVLKRTMTSMENKKKLDYVSVDRTLRNWLSRADLTPPIPGLNGNTQTSAVLDSAYKPKNR